MKVMFLKFIIYDRGNHSGYSQRALESLTTAL